MKTCELGACFSRSITNSATLGVDLSPSLPLRERIGWTSAIKSVRKDSRLVVPALRSTAVWTARIMGSYAVTSWRMAGVRLSRAEVGQRVEIRSCRSRTARWRDKETRRLECWAVVAGSGRGG